MFWRGRQVNAHAQWIGKQSFAHSRLQCLRVPSCAEELWGRDCRSQWFLSLRSVACGLEKPLLAGLTLPIFGLVKLRYPSCLALCWQSERLKCFLRRNLFKVFLRGRFEIFGVILGVKTCEVFLCFITIDISWLYCVDFSVASLY